MTETLKKRLFLVFFWLDGEVSELPIPVCDNSMKIAPVEADFSLQIVHMSRSRCNLGRPLCRSAPFQRHIPALKTLDISTEPLVTSSVSVIHGGMSQAKTASSPMRVLVVEDDAEVNAYISNALRDHGHTVDTAFDGEEGFTLATSREYDVLLLDRMMPKRDGLTLLRQLRDQGRSTPVLILSALGDVDDRVEGLKAGGDDYLVKPFALVELLARVEVLVRRGQPSTHSDVILEAGGIKVDLLARSVTRNGETIPLQAREFRLLEFLMRHKNQIVTRTMLLEHVWQYHFDPQTNVIDVHISRLRQKIDTDPANPIIKTVRGAGYTIEDNDA